MRSAKKSKPLTLPDNAPELWPGRCYSNEDLADFFRRVWGKYLPLLSEKYLREKDPRLPRAIRDYPKTFGKTWPSDLRISTQRSRLAAKFDLVRTKGMDAVSPQDLVSIARSLARKRIPSSHPSSRPNT
jgi:hypothetical protein